jgi:epoxyqueuosine reductase
LPNRAVEPDFRARHGLDAPSLVELFGWDEAEFLRRTEGSAIRRIGHERWLRNIAVALGQCALLAEKSSPLYGRGPILALVREHR